MNRNIKILLVKIISFLALLLSEAWYINTKGWDAIVSFFVCLAGLIGSETYDYKYKMKNVTFDNELFDEFLKALPTEGTIRFLNDANMAGFAFYRSNLDDITKFVYNWDNAEHEFINKKIEKKRNTLMGLIKEYLHYSSLNTWPVKGDLQTVPPEWEIEQPDRFKEVVDNLHRKERLIVECHQDLIRKGKTILHK